MKVCYLSVFRDGSGYANQAIHNMLAMEAGGIDVVARAISLSNSKNHELAKRVEHLEKKSTDNIDVVFQHVLPHQFEYKAGVKNIGMFCWETTHFKRSNWAHCCDIMDEIFVPSIQNAQALKNSNVTVPIKILPCACDITRFGNPPEPLDIAPIKNKCVFYAVGEMTRRKNVVAILRAFYSAFSLRDDTVLVIKTNVPGKSPEESTNIFQSAVNDIKKSLHIYIRHQYYPPVICITDFLSDKKLDQLHTACDVFVSASHGEAWCALPGQFISTEDGVEKIEKYSTGKVVTHKRNLCHASPLKRHYNGKIYDVGTSLNRLGLKLTYNHQVLAVKGTLCKPNCKTQNSKEWVKTQDLTTNDYLCIPKPKIEDNARIDLSKFTSYPVNPGGIIRCPGTGKIPAIPYDMDAFAWIVGLYATEGLSDGDAIKFPLSEHETSLYDKLHHNLRKAFGYNFTIDSKIRKSCRILYAHSAILVEIMNRLCGKESYSKFVHPDIANLNAKLRGHYIRGSLDGDSRHSFYTTYSSISPSLAIGYYQILLSLGIVSCILLDDNGVGDRQIYRVEISQDNAIQKLEKFIDKKLPSRNIISSYDDEEHWDDHEYLYVRINSIKEGRYDGQVYNCSVKDDNSYVLNGFAVHNCIPAHDSMGFGNPVILSNWGSFPELTYAQSCRYWEPKDCKFKHPGEIDCGWLIDGQLTPCFGQIDSFPDLYTGDEQWYDPNVCHLIECMRQAYTEWQNGSLNKRGSAARNRATKFSYDKVGPIVKRLLEE